MDHLLRLAEPLSGTEPRALLQKCALIFPCLWTLWWMKDSPRSRLDTPERGDYEKSFLTMLGSKQRKYECFFCGAINQDLLHCFLKWEITASDALEYLPPVLSPSFLGTVISFTARRTLVEHCNKLCKLA